jgi:hypothetical protein
MSGKVDPTFLVVVLVCSIAGYVLYTHWAEQKIAEQDQITVTVGFEVEYVEETPESSDW